MNIALSILVLSSAAAVVFWVMTSLVCAIKNLSLPEIFSAELFRELFWNMKLTRYYLPVLLGIFAIYLMIVSSESKGLASNGCRCDKCEKTAEKLEEVSRRLEAVIKYYALDDDDLFGGDDE